MGTREEIVIFCSEFDLQVLEIKRIYQLLEQKAAKSKAEPVSSELVESLGYWLHNLYSAYEDLFRLTAAFWENSLQPDGKYHYELLRKMRLDIPGIRPAVIREPDAFKNLDELRGFRHVFRHAYSYGLDDERIFFLVDRVLRSKDTLLKDISRFRSDVDAILQTEQD